MARKEMQSTNVRIDTAMIEHVKRVARRLSVERDEVVSFGGLVREALEKCYPLEEENDSCEGRGK